MSIFWIVNLVVWLIVAVIAAPGAFIAAFRQRDVRRGDPMRLATFIIAGLFVGHAVRWLIAPTDVDLWKALYIVGALTGVYVIRLMSAYGRGERV